MSGATDVIAPGSRFAALAHDVLPGGVLYLRVTPKGYLGE